MGECIAKAPTLVRAGREWKTAGGAREEAGEDQVKLEPDSGGLKS